MMDGGRRLWRSAIVSESKSDSERTSTGRLKHGDMALLDNPGTPISADDLARIDPGKRQDLKRALLFVAAKRHCLGHTLSCFLDDPPELIPCQASLGNSPPSLEDDLVVSSSFRYEPRGEPPPDIRHQPPPMDGLLRGHPLAWIEPPGPGIRVPLWARGEWVQIFESLRPGQPAPGSLPRHARRALAMAKVLVAPGHEQTETEQWQAVEKNAATQFRTTGYAVVRGLIPSVHLGALRRYYRALVASGRLPQGDNQVAERYCLHSEPVGMFFHPQLTNLVSRVAGEPVKPSYLYFSSYPSGSALPRHVDRIQCEFSISLLVDYHPEPDGPCGWPLFLEHPERRQSVGADLSLGDGLLYRGCELVHYRNPLPEGHHSSSIFLHYVREDFAGDLS